jgi:hypothetical protein
MKLSRMLTAAVATSIALGGLASPAGAADVAVGFTLTAGALTAGLTGDVTFPERSASHEWQETSTPATIAIDDLSATEAGWNVTVQASDLTDTTAGATIPAGLLSVASVDDVVGQGPDSSTAGITSATVAALDAGGVVVSAPPGAGVGQYEQGIVVHLDIAPNTRAGVYAGTLTVTIAPPL